ncbi:hypothetical protein, partial [Wolbachia endosymbiont of Cylisticus convexus]
MEWTTQGTTQVKVLSPEISGIIEVDIFHRMEDSMEDNDKASYHSLYRDGFHRMEDSMEDNDKASYHSLYRDG